MKLKDIRARLYEVALKEGINDIPTSLQDILKQISVEGIDPEEDATTHVERFMANPTNFQLDPVKVLAFLQEKQAELATSSARVTALNDQLTAVTQELELASTSITINAVPGA